MSTEFMTSAGFKVRRISRWIKARQVMDVTPRHSLYYYATDGDGYRKGQENFHPENGTFLDYFLFNGRKYALERFISNNSVYGMGNVTFTDNDGKLSVIAGYDSENYYNPLLIEFDEYCEHVRIYEEVR